MEQAGKNPRIIMTSCASTRITAHGHCAQTNRLRLQFRTKSGEGGPVYEYAGVTKAVYGDLCKAESIGRFFGQVISAKDDDGKLIYPYTRVDEPAPEGAQ